MGTTRPLTVFLCTVIYCVVSFPPNVIAVITGKTQFPELNVVLQLDDVQVAHYDSVERRLVHRRHSPIKDDDEEQRSLILAFDDIHSRMKKRGLSLMEYFNNTHGIRLYQRITGCELSENGDPGPMQSWDAWDGEQIEGFVYNFQQNTFQSKIEWFDRDHISMAHFAWLYRYTYYPLCIKTLRRYLHMEKISVTRRVKPRVRILKRTLPDSGGVQLSCLATGFYPRHINLTLFRDGQPVAEDQITGGMLLPNGDGTYQMRKSLEISTEELRERHDYTCTAIHLSLDNKLDITFALCPGLTTVSSEFLVPLMVCVFVGLVITGFFIWRRRRAEAQVVPDVKYTTPPYKEENKEPHTTSLN